MFVKLIVCVQFTIKPTSGNSSAKESNIEMCSKLVTCRCLTANRHKFVLFMARLEKGAAKLWAFGRMLDVCLWLTPAAMAKSWLGPKCGLDTTLQLPMRTVNNLNQMFLKHHLPAMLSTIWSSHLPECFGKSKPNPPIEHACRKKIRIRHSQ